MSEPVFRDRRESLQIPVAGAVLGTDLAVPQHARGMVVFAHGSGSSRHSPRNRYVAAELQKAGLATVLADLLTPAEEGRDARSGELRFDIGLLAARVAAVTDWVAADQRTAGLGMGCSARARGPPRRWWLLRNGPGPSRPSFPAGGARTWPDSTSAECASQLC